MDRRGAKVSMPASGRSPALVLAIHRAAYVAQVDEPIVALVSVNVIDLPDWPLSVNVKPSQSVLHISIAGIEQGSMSVDMVAPCPSSGNGKLVSSFYAPNKYASRRIVVKII